MKLHKYSWVMLLLCIATLTEAQLGGIVNNGANIKIMATTNVKTDEGGITNKAAGTINNVGNLYLDKDFSQSGGAVINTGSGWLWFEGAAAQQIFDANPLSVIRSLRIDNGNRVVFNTHVQTSRVDLMNNGSIELGNFNLQIDATNAMTGYDRNNYVITNGTGHLHQELVQNVDVVFPVGTATYNPATLNNRIGGDAFQVRVFDQVFLNGTSGPLETENVVGKTWLIDEGTAGGSDLVVTLQWETSNELTAFDRTMSGIAHHISGSLWDNPTSYTNATGVGANTWTQTRSGITSFSPFVVRDPVADLPVELLEFNAKRQTVDVVKLDWATATEINNQGFEVQRRLDSETNFQTVGWVDGNGNTVLQQNYYLLDNNGYAGTSYYRLRQVDYDGSYEYSLTRAVEGIQTTGDLSVFPNPTSAAVNLRFGNLQSKHATIRIYAADGRLVYQQTALDITTNQVVELPAVADFAAGAYLIQVQLDNEKYISKKFIKRVY